MSACCSIGKESSTRNRQAVCQAEHGFSSTSLLLTLQLQCIDIGDPWDNIYYFIHSAPKVSAMGTSNGAGEAGD